jgi:hypothetical protein
MPYSNSIEKNQFLTKAAQVFENGAEIDPQQARIQELERMAGKLSLELEIAHRPWRALPGKKALSLLPRAKGQMRVEPPDGRAISKSSGVQSVGCGSQQSLPLPPTGFHS